MRVLLVTGSLPPMACGVGSYTLQLARSLADIPGVEVGVLTGPGAATAGGKVDVLAIMNVWSIREFRRVTGVIRGWKPDVVHLQYPAQGYASGVLPSLVLLIAWCIGSRVVRTWHEVTTWNRLREWRGILLFFLQLLPPGPIVVVRPNYLALLHPWLRPAAARRLAYVRSASTIPRSTLPDTERSQLRTALLGGMRRLIVFFGLLLPAKGADLLFDIADPVTDQLLFLGGTAPDSPHRAELEAYAADMRWRGKVSFAGYLPDAAAADRIAVADAVILPFRDGAGVWNTSLHAAMVQGSFVVTTSTSKVGYDATENVWYAVPGDIVAMRAALAGARPRLEVAGRDEWQRIAAEYLALYRAG